MLDYLIVGQGIAGSLLGWFLQKAGQQILIIDDAHQSAASKIAAGIINPITGRRFVKSWMIDTLLPFAKSTYLSLEKELGLSLWEEMDIIRFFSTTSEENNWLAKTTWPGYERYLNTNIKTEALPPFLVRGTGYGGVKGAKMDLGKLIGAFQKYFKQKKCLLSEAFDYQELAIEKESVGYKNYRAKKIIFCEGYAAAKNTWFQHLPFESAKGEVLILKIPNLKLKNIIKKQQFLVPLEAGQFWFGANYEWEDLTCQPTPVGKQFLVEQLEEIIYTDYEIMAHLAAVRPILKDRRPAIGQHPELSEIVIFNGLGTKGTSIAPYWAKRLTDFLIKGIELEAEVNVRRFF